MEQPGDQARDAGSVRLGVDWAPRLLRAVSAPPPDASEEALLNAIEEVQRQRGLLDAADADLLGQLASRPRGDSRLVEQVVREVALIHSSSRFAADRLLAASAQMQRGFGETRARLESGELPWTHAEALLTASIAIEPVAGATGPDGTEPYPVEVERVASERRAEFEAKVLAQIEGCTIGRAKDRIRRVVDTMHPEGMTVRHKAAFEQRYTAIEPGSDGMGWMHLYMDVVTLAAIDGRVTRHAVAAHGEADETRTLAQLRIDTVVDLLLSDTVDATEGQLATGDRWIRRGMRIVPEVHVTVPALTLLGKSDEPGHLRGYGPIDPETARRLTADAPSLFRILTNPETGAALSLGAEHYELTAALRRFLQVRDERCRYPGCSRAAHLCDIDHVKPYAAAHGPTNHDNLLCLCRRDHQDKDRGWDLRIQPDGTAIWTSPYGRTRTTRPAVTFAPQDGLAA